MHKIAIILASALFLLTNIGCKNGGTSSSGSRGHSYGNYYVRYWWSGSSNGIKDIDWLIIYSEFPDHQSYTGPNGKLIATFKDGTSHEIAESSGSVYWVTPSAKPRLIAVDNLDELVERIEISEDEAIDMKFDSPESLIRELTK